MENPDDNLFLMLKIEQAKMEKTDPGIRLNITVQKVKNAKRSSLMYKNVLPNSLLNLILLSLFNLEDLREEISG